MKGKLVQSAVNDDQNMVTESFTEFACKAALAQTPCSVQEQTDRLPILSQAPKSLLYLPPPAYETLLEHFHLTALQISILKFPRFQAYLLTFFDQRDREGSSIREEPEQ